MGSSTYIVEAVLAVVCCLSCVCLGLSERFVRTCTQKQVNRFYVNFTTVYRYALVVPTYVWGKLVVPFMFLRGFKLFSNKYMYDEIELPLLFSSDSILFNGIQIKYPFFYHFSIPRQITVD